MLKVRGYSGIWKVGFFARQLVPLFMKCGSQFVFAYAELSGLCILCALRIVLFCFEIMRIHSLRSSSAGIEFKRCEELSASKGRNQCLCCPKLAILFLIILHY